MCFCLTVSDRKLDLYTGKGMAVEREEEPVAPTRGGQRIGDYFASQKNARTLTPGQVSGEIVSCKLGGGTQFMKQSECVSRGGVPKG